MISNILGRLFRKEREKDIVVEKESPERNLYEELMAEKYKKMPYEYRELRERMAEIREIICGYSKPRFLINHNTRCAYEFMNSELQLVAVTLDDIRLGVVAGTARESPRTGKGSVFPLPFVYFAFRERSGTSKLAT